MFESIFRRFRNSPNQPVQELPAAPPAVQLPHVAVPPPAAQVQQAATAEPAAGVTAVAPPPVHAPPAATPPVEVAPPPPRTLDELKAEFDAIVDEFSTLVGCDPSENVDEDGWRIYQRGSASGRARVLQGEESVLLHVCALVVPLPSDRELTLPLMREILEANTNIVGPVRLGIVGDFVVVSALQPAEHLVREEVFAMIDMTMTIADELDDMLMEKYGATAKKRRRVAAKG